MTTSTAAGSSATLPVVPAPRRWTPSGRSFTLRPDARVTIAASSGAAVRRVAGQLAADLTRVTGSTVAVSTAAARAGDVVLQPGAPDLPETASVAPGDLAAQSYTLTLAGTATVRATGSDGLFHGTQTLLQLLAGGRTLPGGTATDSPAVAERSLVIDVARAYVPPDFLRARVREMAYLKLNTLHLHLTDDQAFRVESSTHPEMVSEQHYTKAQLRDLVAYAAGLHVTVIPEIDMPGHMSAALEQHPDLAVKRSDGHLGLDLSKPGAWPLAQDLLAEYLPVFPSRQWALGADEWLSSARDGAVIEALAAHARTAHGRNATAFDLLAAFVNRADDYLAARGRTTRIWNDQLVENPVVAVHPRVTVGYWYGEPSVSPAALAGAGHPLVNANWNALYALPEEDSYPDPETLYTTFTERTFAGPDERHPQSLPATVTGPAGIAFCIWREAVTSPAPERTVAAGIHDPLRVVAEIGWGTARRAEGYARLAARIRAAGDPPADAAS